MRNCLLLSVHIDRYLTSCHMCTFLDSIKLRWTNRLPQESIGQGKFRAKTYKLPFPHPTFAVGFRQEKQIALAEPPFSASWEVHRRFNTKALQLPRVHPNTQLHPVPAKAGNLVYPCFVHALKTQLESLTCAANQLAESLAFVLDQQEELRQLAGAPEEERMPVFGVASEGCQVKLWCGAYVGNEIVSWATRRPRVASSYSLAILISLPQHIVDWHRTLELKWPADACAFIKFTHALHAWILETYAPTIIKWLDALWLKARANPRAMGSEDARPLQALECVAQIDE